MMLVAILLLSQPLPTKVPVLDVIISNQSRNIYIYHKGGDPLFRGQYQILIDGGDQTGNFTNSGDEPWSVGETLSNTTPSMPHRVVIVLNGSGSGGRYPRRAGPLRSKDGTQVQRNGWYNLSARASATGPTGRASPSTIPRSPPRASPPSRSSSASPRTRISRPMPVLPGTTSSSPPQTGHQAPPRDREPTRAAASWPG